MKKHNKQLISALNIVKGFISVTDFTDRQFVDYMNKNKLWGLLDDKNLVFSPWMEPGHYLKALGQGLSDQEKSDILNRQV